ncbi:MAG: DUF11 domain-containing protein [Planctomycetaceae bacterium]|nr:DUF11 domain-containing protein [Planctomycetaceae bacterium]
MQSGNSIWKLTALAGCVGLGLLGLLQFQRSMAPQSTAKTEKKASLDGFKPLEDLDRPAINELPDGNSEPPTLTTRSRRASSLDEDFTFDDPPVKKSTNRTSTSRVSFDSMDEEDSSIQSEPTSVPLRNRAPRAELSLEDFPDDSATDVTPNDNKNKNLEPAEFPAFDEDIKPVPVPQNAKKQAQAAIKLARKLIDEDQLEEARVIAVEAAELPATFGPLEDTPEAVLDEIDRLTAINQPSKNDLSSVVVKEPITLTSGTREGRGISLDLDEPSFDEKPIQVTPKKKSPFDDDEKLFADNPPKTINGKARLPDPPVPPAEDPPLELEFPGDSDMPPAEPIKARHKTNDTPPPNRLNSTATAPLDANAAESVTGDGTVRADAPRGPQRPELKIEKIAPPNATLNQPMVYTIVIRNIGESAANAVVVEDQVPMGTKLSGTIPRAELSGKKLIWRLGTIKPGEQKEIQVKVVPVAEGQVGSIATVNFTAEVASRTTIASPKLSLKLTATPQVRVNEIATLNFQITNNGSVDASRVVLRNLIPENLKLADVTERDLEYEIGTIPAGKTQTVQLPLTALRPGKAVNRATITTDGASAAEQQVEINVIGQIVGLSRHGQTNWFVGRPIEFENRLTNNSLNPTNNTVIVESLPSTVEFASASDGGRFDAKQRTVTWHIPHLEPNQTLALKVKVVPKAIGNHAGSVHVTENSRKGAAADYQFRAIGTSDLKIEFAEKAEAYSKGEQFTTRMVIRNKGSGAASNVAVRVTLPAELQFVSVRGPASHTISGREIIFEPINEIGGQGNVHFDLTLKAINAGDSKLQVELQSDQFKKPLTHEEALVIFGGN